MSAFRGEADIVIVWHDLFGKPLHTFPDHALELQSFTTRTAPREALVASAA
jgi:hypothetical protein